MDNEYDPETGTGSWSPYDTGTGDDADAQRERVEPVDVAEDDVRRGAKFFEQTVMEQMGFIHDEKRFLRCCVWHDGGASMCTDLSSLL